MHQAVIDVPAKCAWYEDEVHWLQAPERTAKALHLCWPQWQRCDGRLILETPAKRYIRPPEVDEFKMARVSPGTFEEDLSNALILLLTRCGDLCDPIGILCQIGCISADRADVYDGDGDAG
jgi:hypothetical protein